MSRKLVLILVFLMLYGFFAFLFAKPVVADQLPSDVFTIRADGSIYPSTSLISTSDNITYTLTGNISSNSNGIVVEKDNIVLDGAGFTVHGNGTGNFAQDSNGLYLNGASNVTIRNMTVASFRYGILLNSSSNNSILGNNIASSIDYGIELDYSSNNSITINNLTDSGIGIYLGNSSSNTVSGNILINNFHGIFLDSSSNNTICRNNIRGYDVTGYSGDGIGIISSSSNIIFGNNIIANSVGIYLVYVSNSTISGNNVTNGTYGIWGLDSSSSNIIFHNNFANNNIQHSSTGVSVNIWDNGYPSGGNYWSDYKGTDFHSGPYQNETGSDGIGDTPYVIDANNTDHYPLMGTFQSFNVSAWNIRVDLFEEVEVTSNLTVSDAQIVGYFLTDRQYPWHLSLKTPVVNGSSYFCRVTFPNNMLNSSEYPVFIGPYNQISSRIIQSNGTYTTIYFLFNQTFSNYNIDIVPEFPSFLFLPLFMIAASLAIIVYKRRHLTRV